MNIVRFRVGHADGRTEELVTESSQVLIGSGRHCEIRLPVEQARVEHVLVEIAPAGLRATARSLDPPPKLDGAEFTQAPIIGEAVLVVGGTRIEILPEQAPAGSDQVLRAATKRNPRLYAYLALGVAGCAAMLAARGARTPALAEPSKVPSLFDPGAPQCPQAHADQAGALADDRLSLAIAKQERSPFHPEDGVAAVPLYRTAEACFRSIGDEGAAREAGASADRLERQMTEQFRFHRVRLQRSLSLQEWSSSEHEASVLLSFLGAGGEYAGWLSNLRRKLLLTYISKKER